MGGGIPLPRWDFLDFWGILKPGFWCIIKFKLTSILAPNVYDCSTGGGGGYRFCCRQGGGCGILTLGNLGY